MCFAVEETNRSDLRSYEHNKTISWNEAWKKSGPYGILTHDLCYTGAALYQPANCAKKPTGTWSSCWFQQALFQLLVL